MTEQPVFEVVIHGLDSIGFLGLLDRMTKKFAAIMLQELEEVIGKDNELWPSVRKIVLDYLNDYKRTIGRLVLGGDFEGS